jgi:type I restriction enzyme S subunit
MKQSWKMVKLGEVLDHRKGFIQIDDLEKYKLCRVQTSARGIVLRSEVLGSEIRTKKQQVCKAGDFLVAEIDAKMGGYGIVPEDLAGAIVSSHYFLYDIIEDKLDKTYLEFFSQTPRFFEQVKAEGSTNYAAHSTKSCFDLRNPSPAPVRATAYCRAVGSFERKIDAVRALRGEQVREVERVKSDFLNRLFDELGKEFGVVDFNQIVELKHGFQFRDFHFKEKGIPVVKIGQIKPDGTSDLSNCSFVSNDDAKQFANFQIFKDDLLMALTGGTLGKVC